MRKINKNKNKNRRYKKKINKQDRKKKLQCFHTLSLFVLFLLYGSGNNTTSIVSLRLENIFVHQFTPHVSLKDIFLFSPSCCGTPKENNVEKKEKRMKGRKCFFSILLHSILFYLFFSADERKLYKHFT